jgi:dihydroorotate dehydrogenase
MYRFLFRNFLSKLDPEFAHSLAFLVIRLLAVPPFSAIARRMSRPLPQLQVHALGHDFTTPFGVAAGFDKDGRGILGLGNLGFGHVEVGTVTAVAQPGNAKPRLFRLVKDRAVINRMGFNNHGAVELARRLEKVRRRKRRPIIGVNIGKSRVVNVENAIDDYLESARLVAPFADYLVVNVSSPNTPGLRGLQDADRLRPLLVAVKKAAGATPVLVKIAPDLDNAAVAELARLAVAAKLAGIIETNTTLSRTGLRSDPAVIAAAGDGGLSGAPLAGRSLELLGVIRSVVPSEFCVISVGGIESADDVRNRLDAGATLVQGYTAFLYRGPLWAREINRGLAP